MRYHGVGGFGYDDVSDDRILSLLEELSDSAWKHAVEG